MDERPFWERPEDDTEGQPEDRRSHDAEPDPTEGVRIIGADEAAEAIERGEVASRRGMGTPRYGDRPEAPPDDARPALRFPLSASGDPSDVARPRVSGAPQSPMQPWTEPPSGEVPVIVPEAKGDEAADDLEAWSSFASAGPRWRDQSSDWEEPDYDDASMLHDDQTRIGALDTSDRPGPDDFFSFDETEEPAPPPVRVGRQSPRSAPSADLGGPSRRALRSDDPSVPPEEGHGGDRDVRQSVIAGVAFAVVALAVFALGSAPAAVLVAGVVAVCAAELFDSLRRAGYQPAVLLGLVASVSLVGAAYWKGDVALPLVIGLTVVFTLLWYLLGVTRAAPTMNLAVTIFGVAYVGLLGSFAALILAFPYGIGVLIGVELVVAVNDAGALFAGRRFGRRLLAPDISPGKTVEGVIGGGVAGIAVAWLVLGVIGLFPWDTGSAFALGLVVAVVAPLGDLCESMIKRDLGVKDMGNVLPGHGGLLDRFDALLFVLPAAYYLCRLLEVF
ncbi:MAG TPA: phosphatidate cytidylyltransferase [Acidimicrobiales bacterium]|nr:phosphatidate cytidylyltransferase [Acidimicrobiales bacterium]